MKLPSIRAASSQSIDAFIDALWLEEGLSKNTLAAYRRDISMLAEWLAEQDQRLDDMPEHQLHAYFSARHDSTKATFCSGMKALIEHPEQRALLISDPARVSGAVEEALAGVAE